MKLLFIASGGIEWASARMRAFWVAPHLGADVVTPDALGSVDPSDYDVTIWQKHVNIPAIKQLHDAGRAVWLDYCDPLHWFDPAGAREVFNNISGVACSSVELARDLQAWLGPDFDGVGERRFVHVIPDRLDLSHFPKQAAHSDHKPTRLIWYGLGVNRAALYAALAYLDRLAANGYEISLTVADDRPDRPFLETRSFPVYNTLWTLERENEILAAHDIALLPPYPGAWGRVKSNNKRLTAWACGLPVTDGQDWAELELLVSDASARALAVDVGRQSLHKFYRVDQSAQDWRRVLGVGHV